MQNSNPSSSSDKTHNVELGLKVLTICSTENYQNHHHSCIMNTNLLSPPPSSAFFSHIGDYIGMESCLDLENYEDVPTMNGGGESSEAKKVQSFRCKRNHRFAMEKKEFPPPISLIARTENLSSHMPFVLKRYYTDDGRLILTEERVRHHEYFRVNRSNGNLTLQLVPLDDDDLFPPFGCQKENDHEQHSNTEGEQELRPFVDVNGNDKQQCNDEEEQEKELSLCGREQHCDDEEREEEEEAEAKPNVETVDSCEKSAYVCDIDDNSNGKKEQVADANIEGLIANVYQTAQIAESSMEDETTFGSGKCLNYNSVIMSSSCFLGLPVPAIKPVHT